MRNFVASCCPHAAMRGDGIISRSTTAARLSTLHGDILNLRGPISVYLAVKTPFVSMGDSSAVTRSHDVRWSANSGTPSATGRGYSKVKSLLEKPLREL